MSTIAELMNMTPDAYRPDLVTAEQIEQHLAELDGRWFNEDPAVFGWARELAQRHPSAERTSWWAAHIHQRAIDLRVEHQRRIDECERLEAEYNARQKAERRAQRQAAKQAQPATQPEPKPAQPAKPAPIWHQIPAELQSRRQWVCWRYEARNDKPTKVPYNPHTGQLASTTAPRTWSTFEQAKAAYLERPDFHDGIGFVFSKNDPYCGVDLDHCINDAGEISSWAAEREAQLQASGAYTETSVSGTGVHAIVLATIGRGIKKPLGEIYDRGRFFTFSGRRRPGSTPIGDGQAAIDALYAELRGSTSSASDKPAQNSAGSDCDRAELAASHPESEWEEARQLARTKRDLLLKRSLLATQKEVTQPRAGQPSQVNQGYYATRLLWAELHELLPAIGLYRADGTLDNSQTYAVMARALYGRGFTFPEYVVIMSHHFAAQALAKWGDKQRWREDLASCWQHAIEKTRYTPRAAQARPTAAVAIPAKPRGRASNHAEQVERVYQLLLEHRAGAQALVQTAELAIEADMHRVTLVNILGELRGAEGRPVRITTERNGRYGGLVVSFPDVAIVAAAEPAERTPAPQTAIEPAAPLEETRVPNSTSCVSSEHAKAGYSSPTVEQPDLATLAAEYLADPEAGRLGLRSKATGEAVRRHTAAHFAELVEPYGYSGQEARAAYKAEQQRLAEIERAEWERFFARLKAMTDAELVAYVDGGCRREVAELARQRSIATRFDQHKYQARLRCAKQNLQWRGVELPKQPAQPSARPSKPARAKQPRLQACEPLRFEIPPASQVEPVPSFDRLYSFLKARQAGQQRPAAAD